MEGFRSTALWLRTLVIVLVAGTARADELSNRAFRIQYDEAGIRSLKRTNDVHDTDYIAPNGALGRLLIRYRVAPNGDWRELRDLVLRPRVLQQQSIAIVMRA